MPKKMIKAILKLLQFKPQMFFYKSNTKIFLLVYVKFHEKASEKHFLLSE